MRIVGGRLRGRALAAPAQAGAASAIRPTSDRVRETIFNILLHRFDDPVTGARVLDLFAGTGAMACEALSRGARFAMLVDHGVEARGIIRGNVDALGLGGATRLFRRDATRMGDAAPNAPFGLVFCDPPYGQNLAAAALRSCLDGGWLAPDALAVVEEDATAPVGLPAPFTELDRRAVGDTQIVFGRLSA